MYNSNIINIYRELSDEEYNIIRGAINCDIEEITRALEADPSCINQTDGSLGLTALHIAALDMNYPMVDYLCAQPGIRIDLQDSRGRTPYLIAIAMGADRILERIMRDAYQELDSILEEDETENIVPFKPKPPSGPQ
jgi:ankyrin repeat protein